MKKLFFIAISLAFTFSNYAQDEPYLSIYSSQNWLNPEYLIDGDPNTSTFSEDEVLDNGDEIIIIQLNGTSYINSITLNIKDAINTDFWMGISSTPSVSFSDGFALDNLFGEVTIEVQSSAKFIYLIDIMHGDIELAELTVDFEFNETDPPTQIPRQGLGGEYNSKEVQGIWSISPNYQISTPLNDFGNQYGLCYSHTNAGYGTKKALGGFGHQISYTANGIANAVISLSNGYAYFKGSVGVGISPNRDLYGLNPKLIVNVPLQTPPEPDELGWKSQGFELTGAGRSLYFGMMAGSNSTYPSWIQTSYISSAGIYNPLLLNPNGGNVGIGTTNPEATLHVNGDIRAGQWSGLLKIGTDYGSVRIGSMGNWIHFETTDNEKYYFNKPVAITGELGAMRDLRINTGISTNGIGTERMTILHSTGNVGIGTTSPKSKLEVFSTSTLGTYFSTDRASLRLTNGSISMVADANELYTNDHFYLGAGYDRNFYFRNVRESSYEELMMISSSGNVGIGTTTPDYKLDVAGTVRACEVMVNVKSGDCPPDYVFADDYKLRPLAEVEKFVNENKHLPEIAPAAEMEANGMALKEMNMLMLKKIEELTLYMIDMQKQMDNKDAAIKALQAEIELLKK